MADTTNKKSRVATTVAAVGLAAAMLIGGGTYAYLQSSSDVVNNLFNPNEVKGTAITETAGTSFEVIPGKSVTKDPVVKTTASVDFWQFVIVNDETYLGSANGDKNVADWSIADGWDVLNGSKDDSFILYRSVSVGENEGTNTEYTQSIIKNDTVTFSSALTNEDMWNADLTKSISFQAFAIQKEGFATAEAAWAQIKGTATVSDSEPVAESGPTTLNATLGDDTLATAEVPEGAVTDGTSELTLTVIPQEASAATQNEEGVKLEIEDPTREVVNYNVSITGIKEGNTEEISVKIFVGKNLENVKVYHSGTLIDDSTYDSSTGIVSFKTKSFSDYTVAFDLDKWSAHKAKSFSSIDTDNKVLTIKSAEELALFASSAADYVGYTVKLGADIDLAGHQWVPIKTAYNASLTFDGNNKTISNLIIKTTSDDVGLFANATGLTIKNIKLNNVNINARQRVGAICGQMISGSIDNCHVTNAIITATPCKGTSGNAQDLTTSYYGGAKAGGIIGYQSDQTNTDVTNCTISNATITGYRDVGGIAGFAQGESPTITNCKVSNSTVKLETVESYETDDGNAPSANVGAVYGRISGTPDTTGTTTENVTVTPAQGE